MGFWSDRQAISYFGAMTLYFNDDQICLYVFSSFLYKGILFLCPATKSSGVLCYTF